jgi:hypothetical protein
VTVSQALRARLRSHRPSGTFATGFSKSVLVKPFDGFLQIGSAAFRHPDCPRILPDIRSVPEGEKCKTGDRKCKTGDRSDALNLRHRRSPAALPSRKEQCGIGFQPVCGQASRRLPKPVIRRTCKRRSLGCTKETGWKPIYIAPTSKKNPLCDLCDLLSATPSLGLYLPGGCLFLRIAIGPAEKRALCSVLKIEHVACALA